MFGLRAPNFFFVTPEFQPGTEKKSVCVCVFSHAADCLLIR